MAPLLNCLNLRRINKIVRGAVLKVVIAAFNTASM